MAALMASMLVPLGQRVDEIYQEARVFDVAYMCEPCLGGPLNRR